MLAQATIPENQAFLAAVIGSAIPIVLWLVFFYTRDRYDREPKRVIAFLFVLGALPVALAAGLINGTTVAVLQPLVGPVLALVVVAVVVAPIGEEALKYAGARTMRRSRIFDEPVDGMIYGSTVGLGFAFAENIDYLLMGYLGIPISGDLLLCEPGLECLLTLTVVRGLGSALLHAVATGIAGYFLSQRVLGRRPASVERRGLRWAVAIHAGWNLSSLVAPAAALLVLGGAVVVYTVLARRALAASPHRLAEVDDRHHWIEHFAVGDGTLQRCPRCRHLHSATAHRCPMCGRALLPGPVLHAQPCPACGQPQPATARFCSACGRAQPERVAGG